MYSIADLENLSGIKAHTIRIWEKRYELLFPGRTDTNIRHYSDQQLRHLLNIALMIQKGMKISHLAKFSRQDLHEMVRKEFISENNHELKFQYYINNLLLAGMTYDEVEFLYWFNTITSVHGIYNAFKEIVYPMLNKLGLMWQLEDIYPAQEHFISHLVMQQLYRAMTFHQESSQEYKWLLFLPENEFHEIGLLMCKYLLVQSGYHVIYLGQNVPLENLKKAVDAVNPSHLFFLIFKSHGIVNSQKLIHNLERTYPALNICFAGNSDELKGLKIGAQTQFVQDLEEFVNQFQL